MIKENLLHMCLGGAFIEKSNANNGKNKCHNCQP